MILHSEDKLLIPRNDILDIINSDIRIYDKQFIMPSQSDIDKYKTKQLANYITHKLTNFIEEQQVLEDRVLKCYRVKWYNDFDEIFTGYNLGEVLLMILKRYPQIVTSMYANQQVYSLDKFCDNEYSIFMVIDYIDLFGLLKYQFNSIACLFKKMEPVDFNVFRMDVKSIDEKYMEKMEFIYNNLYSIENFLEPILLEPTLLEPTLSDQQTHDRFIFDKLFLDEMDTENRRYEHVTMCRSCRYKHQCIVFNKLFSIILKYYQEPDETTDAFGEKLLSMLPLIPFKNYIVDNFDNKQSFNYLFADVSDFLYFLEHEYPQKDFRPLFKDFFSDFYYESYKLDNTCLFISRYN